MQDVIEFDLSDTIARHQALKEITQRLRNRQFSVSVWKDDKRQQLVMGNKLDCVDVSGDFRLITQKQVWRLPLGKSSHVLVYDKWIDIGTQKDGFCYFLVLGLRGGLEPREEEPIRTCRVCGQTKPIADFAITNQRHEHQCKKCKSARSMELARLKKLKSARPSGG